MEELSAMRCDSAIPRVIAVYREVLAHRVIMHYSLPYNALREFGEAALPDLRHALAEWSAEEKTHLSSLLPVRGSDDFRWKVYAILKQDPNPSVQSRAREDEVFRKSGAWKAWLAELDDA